VIDPQALQTATLARHPRGSAVTRVVAAALGAVDPGEAVRRFARREGARLWLGERAYQRRAGGQARVLALGKAAEAMARALLPLLDGWPVVGLLIPKVPPGEPLAGFAVQPGGHPLPDENSLRAGRAALRLANGLGPDDLLICLISGGGSALMSAPVAGVSLADLRALTAALLASGARIDEINRLRRRLDRLKGGGLARLASPARVVSLILSDVVGSPLEAIASGPTAPDPTGRAEARAVLARYGLRAQLPGSIWAALDGKPEPVEPGAFERVHNLLIGSNELALAAGLQQAEREGWAARSLGSAWQGEAREVGPRLVGELAGADGPVCLIAGGETTVTLRGDGRGGRNQELALATARPLAELPGGLLAALATDGEDGPTDAAGAVVSAETLARGLALGLAPEAYMANNDAYAYFAALGDLLQPGPTGTNVNDLTFLFRE
jgi:hydroxypyruvate reductase